MLKLTNQIIKNTIADSAIIFSRGKSLYEHGSFFLSNKNPDNNSFTYMVDGNYGVYETRINLTDKGVSYACNCPYPGSGCKHVVAALLTTRDLLDRPKPVDDEPDTVYLSEKQIRNQALDDRKKRARTERFSVETGDMLKGDHLVITQTGRKYTVTLHDPGKKTGHCDCPDYLTSGLGTCKHILFLCDHLKKQKKFSKQLAKESFPFIDIFWDSGASAPRLYAEKALPPDLAPVLNNYFDTKGSYLPDHFQTFPELMEFVFSDKRVRIREPLLHRIDHELQKQQLEAMALETMPEPAFKNTSLSLSETGGVLWSFETRGFNR